MKQVVKRVISRAVRNERSWGLYAMSLLRNTFWHIESERTNYLRERGQEGFEARPPEASASVGTRRAVWRHEHVVNVCGAAYAARTYIEHRDLRELLARITGGSRSGAACEVGAGYGRMTVVLTEFFDDVAGFEREPHFVEEATQLLPAIRFERVDSLTRLPASNECFDFVLTFTVLQHLTGRVVATVAGEISRILRPGGHLLICELTDPDHTDGAIDDPDGMCTIGRPVSEYESLFYGLSLRETRPRRAEPPYSQSALGTYMHFVK